MDIFGNILAIYLGILFIIVITIFVIYILIMIVNDIKKELKNKGE